MFNANILIRKIGKWWKALKVMNKLYELIYSRYGWFKITQPCNDTYKGTFNQWSAEKLFLYVYIVTKVDYIKMGTWPYTYSFYNDWHLKKCIKFQLKIVSMSSELTSFCKWKKLHYSWFSSLQIKPWRSHSVTHYFEHTCNRRAKKKKLD